MDSNYESFRTEMSSSLVDVGIDEETINKVLSQFDIVSTGFAITRTGKELSLNVGNWYNVFRTYINSCGVEGYSMETLRDKRYIIGCFFREVRKDIADIGTNDCRVWLYRLRDKISDRSRDHYRIILHSFFEWAVENKYLKENPMSPINAIRYEKKQIPHLNRMEIEKLRNVLKTERERFIVEFLLSTGCRVSEIVRMKINNIHQYGDTWECDVINGKGKKDRTVFMNARAINAYQNYMATRDDNCQNILVSQRRAMLNGVMTNVPVTENSLNRFCEELNDRLRDSIHTHITPHVFRHTFGTISHENGMSMEQISLLMGHESVDTTMVYAETSKNMLRDSHAKYAII